jgi:hypothetical protein
MRVNWAVAAGWRLDPAVNVNHIKGIGPMWGSWQTWRDCGTDNVICHSGAKARELLDRAFQAVCNFYVPRSEYEFLQRPVGVKLYEGQYQQEVDGIEDVIVLHLCAACSDIVLLLGYDLSSLPETTDRLAQHRLVNRHGLIRSVIAGSPKTQWVAIDHGRDLDRAYQDLPNLTCDSMTSVLQLLA